MVQITEFYASDMRQVIPVRHGPGTNDIICQIQGTIMDAICDLSEEIGEAEARELCENHGLFLAKWLKSNRIIGTISRVWYPVLVKVHNTSVAGNATYESPHLGAFQIFRYDYAGNIVKDNSDEFLRTLFPGDKLKELDRLFKELLYKYHSAELNEWTWRNYTGKLVDHKVLGIEPEIEMRPEAVIWIDGVPLNKMGRIITMLDRMQKQNPRLTLDATVDCEIYIQPYGSINGFRDNYEMLCKLFIVSTNCGTHVHVSRPNDDETMLKWQIKSKLLKAVKELFENMTFTYKDDNGIEHTVKGFYGYLSTMPGQVQKIFGRLYNYWCGMYVGTNDHGCAVNVTGNEFDGWHIEIRICKFINEAQMTKLIEIVRAIATAVDKMYDAEIKDYSQMVNPKTGKLLDEKQQKAKKAADQRAAFKGLKTVWDKAVAGKLASDTNSKKKAGNRRRNID